MGKENNPVKFMSGAEFQNVELIKLQEKAQFVGEESAKGKEVNRALREAHITEGDEHSILRKAIMLLINKYGGNDDPDFAEFIAFYNLVEEKKDEYDARENEHNI